MFDDIIKKKYTIDNYHLYKFNKDVRSVIDPFDTEKPRDSKTLNRIHHEILVLFKKLQDQGKIQNAHIIGLNNAGIIINVEIKDRTYEASWFFFHGVTKTGLKKLDVFDDFS